MKEAAKKGGRLAKTGTSPFTSIFRNLITNDTQIIAAEKIGVSRQVVNRWVLGVVDPSAECLCKIADAYNVTTDFLLGRTEVKTVDFKKRGFCDYMELDEKHLEKVIKLCRKNSPARDAFIKMLDFVDYIVFKAR